MVILLHAYGQRSNNLFQHINIDSYCRDHGIYFYNPHIQALRQDYPNVGPKNVLLEALLACKLPQLLRRLKLITYVNFEEKAQLAHYQKQLLVHPLVSCNGWWFWHEAVQKYRRHYQTVFQPNVDAQHLHRAFLGRRQPGEKIVGVHIRRGDYRQHEGARYFYPDRVYIDKILAVKAQLGPNCRVIVFSNDAELAKDVYRRSAGDVLFSDRSALEDHYLMSQCDYLLGPPSTFTMWASYMGEVPLLHLYHENEEVLLAKFRVI